MSWGALSLTVEGAQALRPDQFGFKVKLLITSREILGKLVRLSEPQFPVYKTSTSHGHLSLCWDPHPLQALGASLEKENNALHAEWWGELDETGVGGRCTVIASVLIPLVLSSATVWGSGSPFNDLLTLLCANPPRRPEQISTQAVTTCTGWVSVSLFPWPSPPFSVELQLPYLLLKRVENWLYGLSPHQAH